MNLTKLKDLLTKTFGNWSEDNVPRLAAAFSFYAVLSLAPVLVLAVTVASIFLSRAGAEQSLVSQIQSFVGNDKTAELLKSVIDSTHKKGVGSIATVASLVVTFFSASNLFLQLDDAVNAIWGIKQTGSLIRNIIATRLLAFAAVAVFGVLILAWLGLDAWLRLFASQTPGFQGWSYISLLTTALFFTGALGVAYKGLPKGRVKWRDVWPGASIAATGLALSKLAFSFYLARFAGINAYGAAGSLVALLLWIYYSSQIFFFGLEVTYTYASEFGSLKGKNPGDLEFS